MQFLTVSDEIVPVIYSLNIKERFADVVGVFGCGDLPYYYLEFIVTMLGVPCFYINGNHDADEQTSAGQTITEPRGCVALEGRTRAFNGLVLAGLGGCIRYNTSHGAQYTESEMLMRLWRLTPRLFLNKQRYGRYVDVMLTHAPPLGIHNGSDRVHSGFKTFLRLMDRFQPRYLIHGHVHRSYEINMVTETRYNQTMVINTAGYRRLQIDSQELTRPLPQTHAPSSE